jgi:hypothetical protein
VAPRVPLARGWERQLDIEYDGLFYAGTLTPARYDAWLHELAVRFVALPDAPLDYSGRREARLIERGLPYLRLVQRSTDWRVYAVAHPTKLVQGAASLRALGPDSVTLHAGAAGGALIRVRYSPYWKLSGTAAAGACVAPAGQFTSITLRHAGTVRLTIAFSLARIDARSARCNP